MSEEYDVRPPLAAVLMHIQAHPGLELGIHAVSLPMMVSPSLLPSVLLATADGDDEVELRQFLRWVETLRAVEPIAVHAHAPQNAPEWVHVSAQGQLITGAVIEVKVCYRGQHMARLRSAAGDAARVEVPEVVRIVSAEAVAS